MSNKLSIVSEAKMFLQNYVQQMINETQSTDLPGLPKTDTSYQSKKRESDFNRGEYNTDPKRPYFGDRRTNDVPNFQDGANTSSSFTASQKPPMDLRMMGTSAYENSKYYGEKEARFSSTPVLNSRVSAALQSRKPFSSEEQSIRPKYSYQPNSRRVANVPANRYSNTYTPHTYHGKRKSEGNISGSHTSSFGKEYRNRFEAPSEKVKAPSEKVNVTENIAPVGFNFPDGLSPQHPQICLNRLLSFFGRKNAVFDLDYNTDTKSFVVTCKMNGELLTSEHPTLFIARQMCAEKVFIHLVDHTYKGMCTQRLENEIARRLAELCLYKTFAIWRDNEYPVPARIWPARMRSELTNAEKKMKMLGEKIMKDRGIEIVTCNNVNADNSEKKSQEKSREINTEKKDTEILVDEATNSKDSDKCSKQIGPKDKENYEDETNAKDLEAQLKQKELELIELKMKKKEMAKEAPKRIGFPKPSTTLDPSHRIVKKNEEEAERILKIIDEKILGGDLGKTCNLNDEKKETSDKTVLELKSNIVELTGPEEQDSKWELDSPQSVSLYNSDSEDSVNNDDGNSFPERISEDRVDTNDGKTIKNPSNLNICNDVDQPNDPKNCPSMKETDENTKNLSNQEEIDEEISEIEERKPFKLLKNLHGEIDFNQEIKVSGMNKLFKITATLDGATYTAEGKSIAAAKERCAIAILKANDGIEVPFTPLVRFEEIYKAQGCGWTISRHEMDECSTNENWRATWTIHEGSSMKFFTGQGTNKFEAKNACAIKILKEIHGMDCAAGVNSFIKSEVVSD